MPVICPVCQTENRDAAMFCRGCARKLPGFTATGPSLLDGLRGRRSAAAALRAASNPSDMGPQNAPRRFWVGLGALMLAVALAFGGWFGYVTRKLPAPTPGAAPVAATPPRHRQPPEAPSPSETVPLGSSLGAGEAAVAATPPRMPSEGVAQAPAPTPAAPGAPLQRRPAPAPATSTAPAMIAPIAPVAPPRAAAVDPRQGCRNLNFFAAARCEAAHCDQSAYNRHPRCDAVRADRRRDEARRNPMLGT